MKSIFKYTLEVTDFQKLSLPVDSKILSVAEQNMQIVLYALVDTDSDVLDDYLIIIHGTGHPANYVDNQVFLGTVKMANGSLMFHVFYRKL